jgi:hypothetical protein
MPRAEKRAFSGSAVSESPGLSIRNLIVPPVFRAHAVSVACSLLESDEGRKP